MPSLSALRTALGPTSIRTRFAPSVTGHLHLGHAVNAVYVWGIARALGGEVVIRLEDHDRGRYRPEYETSILEDLGWLGLDTTLPLSRQSDHQDRYEAAARRLADSDLVFFCDCTRRMLAEAQGAADGETLRYPGTCRARGLAEGTGRALRVRIEPGVARFDDLRLGPIAQDPATQCGDFVLRDAQGQWTYQHCVVADDMAEGITLVIRGEDILESTGRQLRLMRLLAGRPPRYLHHPLVTDASGKKLSKKEFAKSLGDLRREGWTPERVLGEAAFLGGLLPNSRPLRPTDLPGLFG
ncbi:MAG TPA: glutamate--tRNA ligase family protein [Gemmatimonadales bacterium]|nr:glutamate--tRNA ligase family protein [Gemmatimonadales bacterium]